VVVPRRGPQKIHEEGRWQVGRRQRRLHRRAQGQAEAPEGTRRRLLEQQAWPHAGHHDHQARGIPRHLLQTQQRRIAKAVPNVRKNRQRIKEGKTMTVATTDEMINMVKLSCAAL